MKYGRCTRRDGPHKRTHALQQTASYDRLVGAFYPAQEVRPSGLAGLSLMTNVPQ